MFFSNGIVKIKCLQPKGSDTCTNLVNELMQLKQKLPPKILHLLLITDLNCPKKKFLARIWGVAEPQQIVLSAPAFKIIVLLPAVYDFRG